MKKLIFAFLLLITSCVTDFDEAKEAVENQGFTEVRVGGINMMACGKDDKLGRYFNAKNPQGKNVHGTVCCGIMKGCTVRW